MIRIDSRPDGRPDGRARRAGLLRSHGARLQRRTWHVRIYPSRHYDFDLNTFDVQEIHNPLFSQETLCDNLDFSVLNAPDQTFEGTVLYRLGEHGGENYNLSVDRGHLRQRSHRGAVQRLHYCQLPCSRRMGRGLQRHRRDAGGFL